MPPVQILLAWMLYKKDFIFPIPGSRKLEHIQENLEAANVNLTKEKYKRIETEKYMEAVLARLSLG